MALALAVGFQLGSAARGSRTLGVAAQPLTGDGCGAHARWSGFGRVDADVVGMGGQGGTPWFWWRFAIVAGIHHAVAGGA